MNDPIFPFHPPRTPAGRYQGSWAIGRVLPAVLSGVILLVALLSAPMAWAHGDGETKEGYQLVQQALGYLAENSGSEGVAQALEKVDDALSTTDQKGVDIAKLQGAKAALDAGKVPQARTALEQSIIQALRQLKPATGEETGTTTVPDALPGRGALGGSDWILLAIFLLVAGLGGVLAWRFRPHDNLGHLRAQLGTGSDTDAQPKDREASQ